MSRIRLEGLTKRFGNARRGSTAAVDSVSLDISHGEFVVLLGPSGCGKSTLLRMIAGLLPPSAGRLLLDDRDITHVPPKDRDLAMVFQSYALYPHLPVARNLGFPLRTRGWSRAAIDRKVTEVASVLGLEELLKRRPKELSGGQRQRVALGRALVRDPGAFLMDEPLSNLDAKLRTATRTELTALHRQLGSTFLYVTHDQVEAMTMATRIAVLDKGRLEQAGTPSEVYDTPASVFVAGFMGSPPMNLLDARLESRDGRVHVTARDIDVPLEHPADEPPSRDVVLGVRPEHLTIAGERVPEGPRFRGAVDAIENLGNEEIALCSVGGARLVARGPRPLGLRAGENVTFTTSPHHVHLFDPASGRRLVWRDPEPEVITVNRELDVPAV
ncbi:sn-glycerol-3-phosphate ABC transporter ATP-binding protein UgpC [Saccharopolyspora indica]|uniref:ABC transporter ATP-binding protein n=1 Tax=Saccharopolyspora indica TaxID=1229659 RepID=UPI0022EA400D|nr:sn-glycerol-3-phosphate ABC transporter ATP-binding protein UgpC [Saccharopolyspora indica]MDA3648392.1 sn-glycerol-3-phosphate ABC transporter ATP-binding protein UgpC [Saccharopolyspora indica]